MSRFVFDCETNGLLPDVSKVHCLNMYDVDTHEFIRGLDPEHDFTSARTVTRVSVEQAVRMLEQADEAIGHNIFGYDFEVLRKLYGYTPKEGQKSTDTMTLARLTFPNTEGWDIGLKKSNKFPGAIGNHDLRSWGYRLEMHKGNYDAGFDNWCPSMQDYGERDIDVTVALWKHCMARAPKPNVLQLEMDTQELCSQIERNGFPFNEKAAVVLWQDIKDRSDALTEELRTVFEPWLWGKGPYSDRSETFIPKRDNAKLGYTKGVPFIKLKPTVFNPTSRDHVADRLTVIYGWKPTDFGDAGMPTVNDSILQELPWPEAQKLAELFMLNKRMGAIAEGKQSWLSNAKGGRCHTRYNPTNGTDTRRAAHFSFNISQVPKNEKPWGTRCRGLFHASPGYVMVGADLKTLEDRVLGHYMSRYDNGEYIAESMSGVDPHVKTGTMIGFIDKYGPEKGRSKAKNVRYAIIYGGQDTKIGEMVGGAKADGARIRKLFFQAMPAFGQLYDAVAVVAKNIGWLTLIDGGPIRVNSKHSALNYLLQGSGAVLCKQWITESDRLLKAAGLVHGVGKDYAVLVWSHDEMQIEVKEGLQDKVGSILLEAAVSAGRTLEFVPPLEADYKVGNNWAETH